ncbi:MULTISPECIES: serine/threonine-protein kinase [Ramlibacter]|uniref:Protein kinase n=1 Tax=Ramlibacter pinisoli TaxID=2682844 RepID=A0A6N8ISZ4_9BURK|nr:MULTISPECIES: serine/threonine-protein kinase [Ramlibacter]MBA2964027.1 protein kinase [Ramlibacter sp. CGMCC 1.13660]MVQ28993.1 protein kinase [Ramlibacter pinisoli]
MSATRADGPLGPYDLLRELRHDANGAAWEAFDPRLQRRVALRTLAPRPDAAAQAQFHAAMQAAAGLQHPNIVAVYDCDWADQQGYVATEFVDGENLAQYLARVGRVPALQALALVAQLLSALELAHGQGVVHGGIDPEHVLVTRTGRVKLSGFGVVHLARECAQVDSRADVESAAAIAYRLLVGVPPSRDGAGAAIPPRRLRPDLPPSVDAVFARALAADPGARFQDAGALWAALREAFEPPLWSRPDRPPHPVRGAAPMEPVPAEATLAATAPAAPAPAAPALAEPAPADLPPAELAPAVRPVVVQRVSTVPSVRPPRRLRTQVAVATACLLGVFATATLVLVGELAPAASSAEATVAPARPIAHAVEPAAVETIAAAPAAGPVTTVAAAPLPSPDVPFGPRASPAAEAAVPAPLVAERQDTRTQPAAPVATREAPAERRAPVPRPAAERHAKARPEPAPVHTAQLARPAAAGPEQGCRVHQLALTREICKVAQCTTAEFRGHPVCVRLQAEQRQRDQVAEQALRTR